MKNPIYKVKAILGTPLPEGVELTVTVAHGSGEVTVRYELCCVKVEGIIPAEMPARLVGRAIVGIANDLVKARDRKHRRAAKDLKAIFFAQNPDEETIHPDVARLIRKIDKTHHPESTQIPDWFRKYLGND